ncbi:hypothetical protein HanIR_Chr11g0511001 [Helianthus annuus]|nr:hypothetical protein HanIR_Chr11g0511001 [Helianthus annuus]
MRGYVGLQAQSPVHGLQVLIHPIKTLMSRISRPVCFACTSSLRLLYSEVHIRSKK